MIAANYSEFRNDLKKYLDEVENNNDTLLIKRTTGKGTIMISLEEYNSMMETMHLLSTEANRDHLRKSLDQVKKGKTVRKKLLEE